LCQLPHWPQTHPRAPRSGQRGHKQGAIQLGIQQEETQHGILQPLVGRPGILSDLVPSVQMLPVLLRCQNATYSRLKKLQTLHVALQVAPRARKLPMERAKGLRALERSSLTGSCGLPFQHRNRLYRKVGRGHRQKPNSLRIPTLQRHPEIHYRQQPSRNQLSRADSAALRHRLTKSCRLR
jgi:hypothetical protein